MSAERRLCGLGAEVAWGLLGHGLERMVVDLGEEEGVDAGDDRQFGFGGGEIFDKRRGVAGVRARQEEEIRDRLKGVAGLHNELRGVSAELGERIVVADGLFSLVELRVCPVCWYGQE